MRYDKHVTLCFSRYVRKKFKSVLFYLQLSSLLLGLSGCKSLFLFSSEDTANTQKSDYNLQLGLAYLETGNIPNAKKKLLEAERKNPKDSTIKSTLAYFFEYVGESEKAESYHLKALALNKKGGAIHNNYGRFLCQCGRYEKAEEHFLKAVEDINYINTASAYENAGFCAMRIPDTEKASRYLKIALKHNPHLEKSWLALAQIHHKQQPQLAYEYFQKYQALSTQERLAALVLGIHLAQQLNDDEMAQANIRILKEKYSTSREYQDILATYPELIKNNNPF